MDKIHISTVLGKAIGTFIWLVAEHALGGTRYKSTLGLAWAAFCAIIRFLLSQLWSRKDQKKEEKS